MAYGSILGQSQTQDLSNYLELSGGTMSGAINMDSNKITNLAPGTSGKDAVNYNQVNEAINAPGYFQVSGERYSYAHVFAAICSPQMSGVGFIINNAYLIPLNWKPSNYSYGTVTYLLINTSSNNNIRGRYSLYSPESEAGFGILSMYCNDGELLYPSSGVTFSGNTITVAEPGFYVINLNFGTAN